MGFSRVAAILSILYDDILPRLQEEQTGIPIEVWKNEILCIFGAISQELATVRTIVSFGIFVETLLLEIVSFGIFVETLLLEIVSFGIFVETLLLDTESPQPDVLERSRFERSE